MVPGIRAIIGLDLIDRLGGVTIGPGVTKFSCEMNDATVAAMYSTCGTGDLDIDDPDFTAKFCGGKWTVAWRWKNGPPVVTNKIANYGICPDLRESFDEEL